MQDTRQSTAGFAMEYGEQLARERGLAYDYVVPDEPYMPGYTATDQADAYSYIGIDAMREMFYEGHMPGALSEHPQALFRLHKKLLAHLGQEEQCTWEQWREMVDETKAAIRRRRSNA